MKSVIAGNIKILFNAKGKSSVGLFADACIKAAPLIYETWGLKPPRKCKIYIMTSCQGFLFHVLPWPLIFLYPVMYLIRRKEWHKITGWTVWPWPTCGVKTPALSKLSDRSLRDRIHIPEANPNNIVQAAICHELTHAFSIHLDLPVWLNEGIAMYTVDKFVAKTTVNMETLKSIEAYPHKNQLPNCNFMSKGNDSIVYTYARSYWLTQYLEHNYPGFIRSLLVKHQSHSKIEKLLSIKTGIPKKDFWNEIDQKIVAQFAS